MCGREQARERSCVRERERERESARKKEHHIVASHKGRPGHIWPSVIPMRARPGHSSRGELIQAIHPEAGSSWPSWPKVSRAEGRSWRVIKKKKKVVGSYICLGAHHTTRLVQGYLADKKKSPPS